METGRAVDSFLQACITDMQQKRIQLTLFVDEQASVTMERVRREFNPAQSALIKSHVTLCREDELTPLENVILNLQQRHFAAITIDFGSVIRFADGKGVLLPAIGNQDAFAALRTSILQGIVEKPRLQEPHITLMRPRNSTCTDDIFYQIQQHILPQQLTFRSICLIEQEPGKRWTVVAEFPARLAPEKNTKSGFEK